MTTSSVREANATTIARGFVIRTNFVGPTNHRGSRISARYARDMETTYRVMIDWCHSVDPEQNHMRAAQALLNTINSERADFFESIGESRDSAGRFEITGAGWDQDHYYFLASQP